MKKKKKKQVKPQHFVDMFKKTVAHHITQPETAMSYHLMLAYAEKLRKYNYQPVTIAYGMVHTRVDRRRKNRARKAEPASLAA